MRAPFRHHAASSSLGYFALLCGLGCPSAPTPPNDDDSTSSTPQLTGRLVDIDRGTPLVDCEVGTTRDEAVRSGADGRFAVDVAPGGTLHFLCAGGILHSVRLPDGSGSWDWEIAIDMGTGPDLGVQCVPSLSGNAQPTGLAAGEGSMELRVISPSGTGSWSTTLPSAGWTVQVGGFLRVPEGPYLVTAKAFGGSIAGFAKSATLTCEGNGSTPTTALELATVSTRTIEGTWTAAAGSQYSVAASASLADVDADFAWYEYDVVHDSDADSATFSAELLDGIGSGAATVAGCQRSPSGQRVCLFRLGVVGDSVDLGTLPAYVSVGATLDAGDLSVAAVGTIDEGSVDLLIADEFGDPLWSGWAPGGGDQYAIEVAAEWMEAWPAASTLQSSASGLRGVEFDFATGSAPIDRPDGWSNFRAPLQVAFF